MNTNDMFNFPLK